MLPSDNIAILAIDTETHSPRLKELGPLCIQGEDYCIGISVASPNGFAAYYPLRHNEGNGPHNILLFLRKWCAQPDNLAVFAHAKFDMEFLWSLGIDVKCKVYDVLAVDALIDENKFDYSLDAVGRRYGLAGKQRGELENWMIANRITKPKNKNKVDMGRMREVPPAIVAPYAIGDAKLTLACYRHQQPLIEALNLGRVVKLECDLAPITWEMKLQGVPVDLSAAEQLEVEMRAFTEAYVEEVRETLPDFEPTIAASLEKYVMSFGRIPPRTPTGEPSITNEWLDLQDIAELSQLAHYRQTEKVRRDFVSGVVLERAHNGKLHPNWASTRGGGWSGNDPNGTRTGRLACENPNLAQIPKRHPVLGPKTRALFIPRQGELWHKADYSSQEPRIALHFALKHHLPGSDHLATRYMTDPTTDYHQTTTDLVNKISPIKITRDQGKTIGLGLIYGLGKANMATKLQMTVDDAKLLVMNYHRAVPFIKPLQDACQEYVQEHGFINTVLGRKRHFELWEPLDYSETKSKALSREEAIKAYGTIKRAMAYKALNATVQGSAAEQCKTAMVQLHREGLTPMITLYDELCHSIPNDGKAAETSQKICHIMQEAIPFFIPHVAEPLMGSSWNLKK